MSESATLEAFAEELAKIAASRRAMLEKAPQAMMRLKMYWRILRDTWRLFRR